MTEVAIICFFSESGEVDPTQEQEDQPKQMTLDEWKALQKTERSKPLYKLRKAGEGEEGSQWNKGTALTKKKEVDGEEGEEEEDEEDEVGVWPEHTIYTCILCCQKLARDFTH